MDEIWECVYDAGMSEEVARSSMLPAISWLTSLTEEERELFSTYGSKIAVEPENVVICEGEPQPNFYFILQGTLSVKRGRGENESVVGVVSAGESLGEMTMVTRGVASATVLTLERCELWRISHDDLMRFIREHKEAGNKILLALLCIVSERLQLANSDLAILLSERRSKVVRELSNPD